LKIVVIIPAYNEEASLPKVLAEIPKDLVEAVIVVNNNSTDSTAAVARQNGAICLDEPRQGYGYACLKGIEYAQSLKPDIVVFIDADYSDFPAQMDDLVEPILNQKFDMVIGSRALGKKESGSMTPQQIFGNWLATRLIKLFYGVKYTDLGPFRAIRFDQLMAIEMEDKTYGWTVEMQLKAAKMKLKTCEIPVDYRRRIGISKVSGTVKGTIMAGYKILGWIFKYL
jgi:glycosyltransferase involved in cell wall biosynthesis